MGVWEWLTVAAVAAAAWTAAAIAVAVLTGRAVEYANTGAATILAASPEGLAVNPRPSLCTEFQFQG